MSETKQTSDMVVARLETSMHDMARRVEEMRGEFRGKFDDLASAMNDLRHVVTGNGTIEQGIVYQLRTVERDVQDLRREFGSERERREAAAKDRRGAATQVAVRVVASALIAGLGAAGIILWQHVVSR
jgi:hypothetical protein